MSARASLRTLGSWTTSFDTNMRIRIASPEEPGHNLRYLRPRRAVPVGVRPLPLRSQLFLGSFKDLKRVCAREDVRTDLERLRPLRVLPQSHARDPEKAGLFLESTGVREHQSGVPHQFEHVEIARGRDDLQPRRLEETGKPELAGHLLRPRVDGKHDSDPMPGGDGPHRLEDAFHPVRGVHVLGAVEGEDSETGALQPETLSDLRSLRGVDILHDRVDDAVPDDVHALTDTLSLQ